MTKFLTRSEFAALKGALALTKIDKGRTALAITFGSLGLGAAIALSATSAWLIAAAFHTSNVLSLTVATVSVRLFGVSRAVLRYVERLTSHRVALLGMANLRHNVYLKLAPARTDTLSGLRRGDILARTGTDVDAVGDFVVKSLLPAAITIITAIGTVVAIAFLSPAVAFSLACFLLFAGIVGPMLTIRSARIAEEASAKARTELSAVTQTLFEGAPELAVSGRLQNLQKVLAKTEGELVEVKDKAARPAAIAAAVDNLAMAGAVLCALLIGIPQVATGQVSMIGLSVLVLTPLAAFEGTAALAPAALQLIRSAQAAQRIMELLDVHIEQAPKNLTKTDKNPVITAHKLDVGWPAGPTVIAGVNLELTVGKRIAIVGPSGIGKTTLALTLAGMLPPKGGQALLNGIPSWEVARTYVSGQVIFTAEDAHIFATTVLENLRVAKGDISVKRSEELLEKAGLGTWVKALPKAVNTPLGTGGTTISGGERRRLLLARALASPAPLLLLDEPGEHIDPKLADQLIRDLFTNNEILNQRGILIVTHRLSALTTADEIILIDSTSAGPATVIARGTHQQLIDTVPAYKWSLEQEKTNG